MTFTRRAAIATAMGALLAATTLTAPGPAAAAPPGGLDGQALQQSLDAMHEAGMYGVYSSVHDGDRSWGGAAGVADVDTGRPMRPDMVHRIGSITKTFVSVAVLQQVERGAVELDAPIGRYLPDLVPGERGQQITVRMLLNHTSHIADYILPAFPSLGTGSAQSLDDNRFRTTTPEELARLGLGAPATGAPGAQPGSYSNTNYVLLGLLLDKVTGDAEQYITRHVIQRAGLRHTAFPRTPHIPGPHSGAYESLYGLLDPPRDYSVYDPSWLGMAGSMTATMNDLNRFFRALLRGELVGAAQLAEMQKTVTVQAGGGFPFEYGLGLYPLDLPCGRFWGHDGGVFGMITQSLSTPDGSRLISFGLNRSKYQTLDENGLPQLSPIDVALVDHLLLAACGPLAATAKTSARPEVTLFPADRAPVSFPARRR